MSRSVLGRLTALALVAGTVAAVPLSPASAAPDGSGLVINEVYLNGGSSGATYKNKFVELYNPTSEAISVNGWSVQYRAYSQTGNFSAVIPLGDHHVEPGGTFLVSGNANSTFGADLPTPDVDSTVAFSGNSNGGTIALVRSTSALSGDLAAVRGNAATVDLLGYGASNTYEGAPKADGYGLTSSIARAAGRDTDSNLLDFTTGAPTPQACGTACDGGGVVVPEDPEVEKVSIAQIQGTGASTPLAGRTVETTGVVTALYASGGFNGAYVQTPGTGGALPQGHNASHGLFVFGSAFAQDVDLGDTLDITGTVSEFNGLTQISATTWKDAATAGTVTPTPVTFPMDETRRESLEGMLLDATAGTFTVTNNYATNTYGELGLAAGTTPLPQPTNEVRPRTAAYDRLVAENAARLITLDDGKTTNFTSGAGRDVAVPWLTPGNEVRTGARATIEEPLVLDWRNSAWKLQPTEPFSAGDETATVQGGTRELAPREVGGAVKLASFNVLNYFTTTGEDWVSSNRGTCTWYTDRAGNRITVNSCTNDGPRGAANSASLARQQAKIVKAINTLDADVLSLEEIEDTATLGGANRDEALETLVDALNEAAGSRKWAAVASPATIPTVGRDVIRTAFIYQPAVVEPVGPSVILDSEAFQSARAPLAQEFRPVDGDAGQDFLAIVNHFKSKGSGSGADADQGDGQGASNRARIRQAEALVDFVESLESSKDTDRVFLLGDFNSYAKEDPLAIIEEAGFVNVDQSLTQKETYQYDGLHGSLDHVFASKAAFEKVTGADVWQINAPESIGREYSRFNNNVTQLVDPTSPFRASDHDPVLVGFDPGAAAAVATTTTATVPSVIYADEPFDVDVTVGSETGTPRGTVSVLVGEKVVASAQTTTGTATVTVPANSLGVARQYLEVRFAGEGRYTDSATRLTLDVRGEAPLTATAPRGTYGKVTTITVKGAQGAHGLAYAVVGGKLIASAMMTDGEAIIRVPGTALRPGTTKVEVHYGGSRVVEPGSTSLDVTIAKARATVTASVASKKVTTKSRAVVKVRVRTSGFTERTGTVTIRRGSKVVGTAKVRNGRATVKLAKLRTKGVKTLTVRFNGSSTTSPAAKTLRIRVR